MDLESFSQKIRPEIDATLSKNIPLASESHLLSDAMLYAVMAGGKRLRPLLTLAVIATAGKAIDPYLKPASALELMHTYSLIHDDLPAMDNDDFRRGKLTTHRKFGEDIAILAGDALQPLAFEWIASSHELTDSQKVALISKFTQASGQAGMVAGQVKDVLATADNAITLNEAVSIHQLKTGCLIAYAAYAGGVMADVSIAARNMLWEFGMSYGLAFQIKDDLDDLKEDGVLAKQSYPAILGVRGAKKRLSVEVARSRQAIKAFSELTHFETELLLSFLNYFNQTLE